MNDNLESIDKSDKKREQYKETKLVTKIQPLHLLENQKKNRYYEEAVGGATD